VEYGGCTISVFMICTEGGARRSTRWGGGGRKPAGGVLSEHFPALGGFGAGSLVAGYRLEAQVGVGGMAVVFRARDERLGRLVALKILAASLAADEGFRRRFIAESRAAARVDDPHVIPVYEAGESGGVLFIAMRFVQGGDLRRVLGQEGPLPPGRAAGIISPVASALDAAHRAGLVHRDVKPANILVDASAGRPDHVYLSDFGVSKGAVSSVSLTGTGHFLGTPDYSAPEQIQGRATDGRTDQYALACVAFQLLTGSMPFERDQGMAVLLAHLSEPPPPLASRRPGLPGAADQVLARALAKVPEKRYGSCREFADALREALGLPPYASDGADAPSPPRTEVSAAGAGAVGLADPTDARAAAGDIVRAPAGVRGDSADRVGKQGMPARELDTPTADADRPPTVAGALTGAQRVRPGPGDGAAGPDRRPRRRFLAIGLACAILAAAVAVPLALAIPGAPRAPSPSHAAARTPASTPPLPGQLTGTLTGPAGGAVDSVAFGPGGTTLAAANLDGSIDLWDTATGKITTLTDPASGGVDSVAFGPGGTTLAAGDLNGSIYLWSTATGKITASLSDPCAYLDTVAFGPGGATVASDCGISIYLWDTATGKITATLTDPGCCGDLQTLAFGPGGATLATANDEDGSIYLWDAATGKITATLTDPSGSGVDSVAFGPGGTTLAAGDANGSTYIWDTVTGQITASLSDPGGGAVQAVAFGPGGATLATAGAENGSIYLWDTATGKIIGTLTDPSDGVDSVAFGPGGTTLAAGGANGTTYLWRITK